MTTKRKPKPKPEPAADQVKDWPEREYDMLVIEALIADIWAFRREAEAKQAADLSAKQAA